ncbi:hypothetical protein BDR26DRAFT_872504 [Obelidium mucronatum]|nr:hypothetical protein BDR26DRAFT_872504 [Obelidium mucronatum]
MKKCLQFKNMASLIREESSHIAVRIYSVSVAISVIEVAYVIHFAIYQESVKTMRQFASPFNISLLGSILGVASYSLVSAMISTREFTQFRGEEVLRFLASISLVWIEICYMYYSWIRSKDILRFHRPSLLINKFLTFVAPFVFASKIISVALCEFYSTPLSENRSTMKDLVIYSLLLGGLLTCVFDTSLLVCFIVYLRKSVQGMDTGEMKPEFRIIAWHGIAASSLCYCGIAIMTYIAADPDILLERYYSTGLASLFTLVLVMIMGALIRMKVRVFQTKELELTNDRDEIVKKAVEAEETYFKTLSNLTLAPA